MAGADQSRLASGIPVRHVGQTQSTNDDALSLAQSGETGPLWIVADRQSGGRGRAGRVWASDATGNFYGSFLTTLTCPPATAAQLALVAGVALFDAVRDVGQRSMGDGSGRRWGDLRLKWPNDLLLGTSKVGGVLIETNAGSSGQSLSVAIGLGVNLIHSPQGLDRPVANLCEGGQNVRVTQLLDALSLKIAHWISVWDEGRGFSAIAKRWVDCAGPIGERVSVTIDGKRLTGRYEGLNEQGGLAVVDDAGTVRHVTFGDVDILE